MTARSSFNTSVANALAVENNTVQAAVVLAQESVNLAGNPTLALASGSGNATYVAKVKSAAKTLAASAATAATVATAAIDVATSTLKATGDVAPL